MTSSREEERGPYSMCIASQGPENLSIGYKVEIMRISAFVATFPVGNHVLIIPPSF